MVRAGLKFTFLFLCVTLLGVCCPFSNLPILQNNETEITINPHPTKTSENLPQENTINQTTAVTATLSIPTPANSFTLTPEILDSGSSQTSTLYQISETIHIRNEGPGKATSLTLWIATIRSISPYQEMIQSTFDPPYENLETDEFGNEYAYYELENIPVGAEFEFTLSYKVKVYDLDFDLGDCRGNLPDFYTQPEEFIESDAPLIKQLSNELSEGKTTACEITRSYYDYIAGSFNYRGYTDNSLGALWALENKGGDCTEFSDSLIALSRASDIPARFLEGVTCCTESGYDPGQNKHDWLELYLPETGWVPMDPTWGRSSYDRETYYAGMTSDHIIVTQGRNPQTLNGYHYYTYNYWWGETSTIVSSEETWSILQSFE